jgi:hypothetical protein
VYFNFNSVFQNFFFHGKLPHYSIYLWRKTFYKLCYSILKGYSRRRCGSRSTYQFQLYKICNNDEQQQQKQQHFSSLLQQELSTVPRVSERIRVISRAFLLQKSIFKEKKKEKVQLEIKKETEE